MKYPWNSPNQNWSMWIISRSAITAIPSPAEHSQAAPLDRGASISTQWQVAEIQHFISFIYPFLISPPIQYYLTICTSKEIVVTNTSQVGKGLDHNRVASASCW